MGQDQRRAGTNRDANRRGRHRAHSPEGLRARLRRGGVHQERRSLRLRQPKASAEARSAQCDLPRTGAGLPQDPDYSQHGSRRHSLRHLLQPGPPDHGTDRLHQVARLQHPGVRTDVALRPNDPDVRGCWPRAAWRKRPAPVAALRLQGPTADHLHRRECYP